MARRDEILAYARELLDLDAYPDYGPMGMQVVGAALVVVHHGLLWNNESRVIDARMKGRLQALFAHDMTLAAYHLALDAHSEVGNNALLARELGVEVERPFDRIGVGG